MVYNKYVIIQKILLYLFNCLTQFSYKFNANSNSVFQSTRKQHTCTMRVNYRVLIFIEKYPAVQSRRSLFLPKGTCFANYTTAIICKITRIAKYPLSAERSIDDVDIEHYNFCFRAWRTYHPITSVLSRESEYKFRLLCQTCREKVPDSRRARKQSLCASKESDKKVRFLSVSGEMLILFRFS